MRNPVKHCLIYKGPGANKDCIAHIQDFLLAHFSDQISIDLLSRYQLLKNAWQETAHCLIMPGGRDIPYAKYLHGAGTDKIKNFILSGGRYLGICAGGLFCRHANSF